MKKIQIHRAAQHNGKAHTCKEWGLQPNDTRRMAEATGISRLSIHQVLYSTSRNSIVEELGRLAKTDRDKFGDRLLELTATRP